MEVIMVTLAVLVGVSVLGAILTALTAHLSGVLVKSVHLGAGPSLISFQRWGIPISVRVIPISCNVEVAGFNVDDDLDLEEEKKLRNKPWFTRVLTVFWISLLPVISGILVLGGDSISVLKSAVPDYVFGAWSPHEVGQPAFQKYADYFNKEGWFKASGVALIRVHALALVPFVTFQGIGQILMTLVNKKPNEGFQMFVTLTVLLAFGCVAVWIYSVIRFFLIA